MIEKTLKKYILPNIMAMVGVSCYILADTFFISMAEGTEGITALNLVLPIYGLIFATGAMIGTGSATRYSLRKSMGKSDYDDYFSNSIFWSLIVGAVFLFFGMFRTESILRFFGTDDTIMNIALPYIRTALIFTPFFIVNYTFTSFVRNDSSPNIAMAATLLSGLFNILFDYVFMFPMKMGMIGAALATGTSPIISIIICMAHYLSKRNTIKLRLIIPSFGKFISSCKLGMVAFVGEISSGITTMIFNFILLSLGGNIAVAAYGIIANIAIVSASLLNGVSLGLQPLASKVHGSGDIEGERRIYKSSLKTGIVISTVFVILNIIFADEIIAMFNKNNSSELISYTKTGIFLFVPGFLLAAANTVKAGFYSATGKARESSAISISRGVIAIVFFALLLSHLFGIVGVWLAFPVAELFTLLLTKIFIDDETTPRISD